MNEFTITPMQPAHLADVAQLHASSLAGDFLPSLGVHFLKVFYEAALRSGLAFGFVCTEGEGDVSGFVFGSRNTPALFKRVAIGSALPLGWAALPALLKQPGLLLQVAETFLYPSKEEGLVGDAELLVIAVAAPLRSRGLGAALVKALDEAFRCGGVPAYKVTVLESNQGANRFYRKIGFRPVGQFRLYRKTWNIYLCVLG